MRKLRGRCNSRRLQSFFVTSGIEPEGRERRRGGDEIVNESFGRAVPLSPRNPDTTSRINSCACSLWFGDCVRACAGHPKNILCNESNGTVIFGLAVSHRNQNNWPPNSMAVPRSTSQVICGALYVEMAAPMGCTYNVHFHLARTRR